LKKLQVFVYGTLQEGEENHNLISEYNPIIEKDYIKGVKKDTGLGFPAVFEGDNWVQGEVLKFLKDDASEVIKILDRLEAVPMLYTREKTTTKNGLEVFYYKGTESLK